MSIRFKLVSRRLEFPGVGQCAHVGTHASKVNGREGVAMSDRLASRGKYVEYLNKSKQPK